MSLSADGHAQVLQSHRRCPLSLPRHQPSGWSAGVGHRLGHPHWALITCPYRPATNSLHLHNWAWSTTPISTLFCTGVLLLLLLTPSGIRLAHGTATIHSASSSSTALFERDYNTSVANTSSYKTHYYSLFSMHSSSSTLPSLTSSASLSSASSSVLKSDSTQPSSVTSPDKGDPSLFISSGVTSKRSLHPDMHTATSRTLLASYLSDTISITRKRRSSSPSSPLVKTDLTDKRIHDVCNLKTPCERIRELQLTNLKFCHMFYVLPVIYKIPLSDSSFKLPKNEINQCLKSMIGGRPSNSTDFSTSLDDLTPVTFSRLVKYFETKELCSSSLMEIKAQDKRVEKDVDGFMDILQRYPCVGWHSSQPEQESNPGISNCQECKTAYHQWICSNHFDLYLFPKQEEEEPIVPTTQSTLLSSYNASLLSNLSFEVRPTYLKIPSCSIWCTMVETNCPYFNPTEYTWNGGEPIFLCNESHYHQSSLYTPPETTNCDLGDNLDCCFAAFHLDNSTNPACPTLATMCSPAFKAAFPHLVNSGISYDDSSLSPDNYSLASNASNTAVASLHTSPVRIHLPLVGLVVLSGWVCGLVASLCSLTFTWCITQQHQSHHTKPSIHLQNSVAYSSLAPSHKHLTIDSINVYDSGNCQQSHWLKRQHVTLELANGKQRRGLV